jgi:transcriptional regulator with XRE-family HTH domain
MTDDLTAALSRRIAEAREAAGLSREELARNAGVTVQTVEEWEAADRTPRANRLTTLGGVLGVSPAWLLSGEGPAPGDSSAALGPGRAEVRAEIDAIRADLERATMALNRLAERLD